MNSLAPLAGSHLRTYNTIFQHPVSHNLGWHDVHALFRRLGEVEEEPNGNLKVTRNGHVLILHPSRMKDVDATEELMALRHFLVRSASAPPAVVTDEPQWLVVIERREARIYRSAAPGTVPQVIRGPATDDFDRRAPLANGAGRGPEKPKPASYFEPLAAVLNGAGKILIFGHGTGLSSEMEQFRIWLKSRRPAVAGRIVGAVVLDDHSMTEGQLLAKAREFHRPAVPPASGAEHVSVVRGDGGGPEAG